MHDLCTGMLAGLTHDSAHSSQQQLSPAPAPQEAAAADGGAGGARPPPPTTTTRAGGSRRHARPVAVAELALVLRALDNQQHHALRVTLAQELGMHTSTVPAALPALALHSTHGHSIFAPSHWLLTCVHSSSSSHCLFSFALNTRARTQSATRATVHSTSTLQDEYNASRAACLEPYGTHFPL